MSAQYSGPPTNGMPFPGPPGGKAPPPMMGRPPFSGPPKFSGAPPTFNGKPPGPPATLAGPPGSGPYMGPPSGFNPGRGPPGGPPPSNAFQPPSFASQPPTQQMENVSLQDSQPPKVPSPASNLFGGPANDSKSLFDNSFPPNKPGPPSSVPGPFGPPSSNPSPFDPPATSSPAPALNSSGPFGPPSTNTPPFGGGLAAANPTPFDAAPPASTAGGPFGSAPPTSNPSPFAPAPPNSNPFGAAPSSNAGPFGGAPPPSNAGPFGQQPSKPPPGQFSAPPASSASPFGAVPPSSTPGPMRPPQTSTNPPFAPPSNSGPFQPAATSAPSFPPRSQAPSQPSPPQSQPNQGPFGPPQSQPNQGPFGPPQPQPNQGPFGPPQSQPNQRPFGPPQPNQRPIGPPQSQPNQGPFGPPQSQPNQGPFGSPQRPTASPFGGPPGPPTSNGPFGQRPASQPGPFGAPTISQPPMSAPSGFGPPPSRPGFGPPSNGPMHPPTSNNLNAFSQPSQSYSPGLQGIQSGPGQQNQNQFGPPSQFSQPPGPLGPPPSSGPPQSNIGPPPSMNGPPPSRGYPGSMSSSGPRRPYPSNMSYGVNSPATLTSPPMPPPPGAAGPGARHPSAPIIANPGAGLAGQLPSVPQPAAQQPPAKSRIDPDLMPNPLDVQKADRTQYEGKHWITTTLGVPPLISTDVPHLDMGNCTPRFIRSAFYTIAATKELANQINMPISFAVQPCARLGPGEAALATVDMSVLGGPLRCRRCKAYINPHVKFVDGGRKFVCNLCGVDTEVPPEYFCNLDHTGRRADTAERPELSRGSYEFLTTTDYCKGSTFPQPAAYIFVIDVTYASFQSGMVQTLTSNIAAVLNNLPKEEGQDKSPIRIGFITYNTQLHFYNLNPALAQPAMLVQPDMSEVFVPVLDGFLVTVEDAQAHLKSLMELIPTLHGEDKKSESLLLPAIQAGCAALKAANRPGKVIMFHSSLPSAPGPGQLKNREDKKLLNTDKEATLLVPADPIFEKVARECVDAGVAVDLFLFPHSYIDVASVGKIPTVTGGVIQRYPMFRADVDGERLIQDLAIHIAQPCVFDAVLRMRTNAGLRGVEFCGNFMMQNATDMEIAVLTPNTCVTIEVKHDDKLNEDFQAYIQVALLYTSMSGVRKLRLHNLALPVSNSLAELYKSCDVDTIANSLAKEFGRALLSNHTHKNLKEQLLTRISNCLACYRQNCAAPSQPGQLILPETLKLLPLYSHCLLRSPALLPSMEVSFDEKSNLLQRLAMMSVQESELFLYPKLYNLNTSTLGNEGLPPIIRSSYDRIRESGAHLLDNGLVLILWVGANTPSKWLQEVFGVTVLDQVDPTIGNLQQFDNPTSIRIREIIDEIRAKRQQHLRLNVVRQKDKTEHIFMQFLVEDKPDQGMNYTDFLCSIHREIRNILS